jgi:hypothetical protein
MNTDTTSGTGTDTTSTDTTSTDTTSTDTPVTITEITEFLRQLRTLSRSSAAGSGLAARDTTAERAAFLARKADLFARIAAQHPDTVPPTTAPPTTQPDGGRA